MGERKPESGPKPAGLATRREVLGGGLGLAGLLAAGRWPQVATAGIHPPARAKNIIYIFLAGGVSQLDTFDPKPELARLDGQLCPDELYAGKRLAFIRSHPKVLGSPYTFKKHGQSGAEVSELMPHLAEVVDDLTFIKSMHCDEFNHGPAQLQLATGVGRFGRPSLGAWLDYAIGSENQDLPGFVNLLGSVDVPAAAGALWGSGMLPGKHQGVRFASPWSPVFYLRNPPGVSQTMQQQDVATVNALNEIALARGGNPETATRMAQYDLALRMQKALPEAADLSQESQATKDDYGVRLNPTSFATQCLLARRLVERDVRMVQVINSGWDHHSNIFKFIRRSSRKVDQPIAALIRDLKQRGLLDETLVVCATEFGRTPIAQGIGLGGEKAIPGRDHQRDAFTVWMAGAGLKPGMTYGKTDELGHQVVENPVHVHDLNATILHLMGLDHEQVTFRFEGRNHRLTDVHGHVVHDILA